MYITLSNFTIIIRLYFERYELTFIFNILDGFFLNIKYEFILKQHFQSLFFLLTPRKEKCLFRKNDGFLINKEKNVQKWRNYPTTLTNK